MAAALSGGSVPMRDDEWRARWDATWRALGAAAPVGELESLLARWDEKSRHYHARRHLEECLHRFDAVRARAARAAEAELAVWYHDAVYDAHRADNEARSAELATAAIARAGVTRAAEVAARVEALILATRHAALPAAPDEALVVDVDLGILAAPAERFDEYERDVRAEYAWVPGILFRRKRREVLEGFLARPRIYTSGAFDADEARARENLARSVAALR